MQPAPDRRWTWLLLAVTATAMAWAAFDLRRGMSAEPEFDALHVYLPLARKLLAAGLAFFATEDSIAVAPLSYIYMALFGAEARPIKLAAIASYALLIAIAARIGMLLHSPLAGMTAAGLLAVSPLLKPFAATALTEPPFLFFTGVWIWSLLEDRHRPRAAWLVLAGVALSLSILIRQTFLFFIPLALAVSAYGWMRQRRRGQSGWARRVFIAHALAAILPALVIAHNALVHKVPAVTLGSGTALYLGNHVVTGGQDPAFSGLLIDEGAVTEGKGHLNIAGDRILRETALVALRDQPLATLAALHLRKLGAFVFVSPAETTAAPQRLRAWRIALLVLAVYGLWHLAWGPRLLLAGIIGYQIALHMPVLYTHRYSVSAIDLPLALLAALGIARGLQAPRQGGIVAALAILGIAIGWLELRNSDPPAPRIDEAPHALVWTMQPTQLAQAPLEGLRRGAEGDLEVVRGGGHLEVAIRNAPLLHPWDNSVLSIEARARGECRALELRYRRDGEADYGHSQRRRLPADGEVRRIDLGAALTMGLNKEGVLRIAADCEPGTQLRIVRMRVTAPRYATYYRDRARGLTAVDPALVLPQRR